MKLLCCLLMFFIPVSGSYADTLFSCVTDKGAFALERGVNNYIVVTDSKTCILTNRTLDVIHNRGQGYDSWELDVGNDAPACSYSIELIDQGHGPKYTVVSRNGTPIRHPCSEGKVVDLLSDR